MINISYKANPKELARASLLYAEKKPFLRMIVLLLNTLATLLLCLMVLKFFLLSLTSQELWASLICAFWLGGRLRLNAWLLKRRIQKSKLNNQILDINVSSNQIEWGNMAQQKNTLDWTNIPFCLEAQNGFLLPSSRTRFLWLPFHGFSKAKEIESFREMLAQKAIKLKRFVKWKC